MNQFLMVFYVVFFSTGFMGGTALLLLNLRVRSRTVRPLLAFQVLFLVGIGLILVYFARSANGATDTMTQVGLPAVIMAINAAVWITVIVIARTVAPGTGGRFSLSSIAQLLAALVIVKSIANVVVISTVPADAVRDAWHLSSHILTALAMASFGLVLRGPVAPSEPPALHPLFRAYGILAIVFSPIGIVEYALNATGVSALGFISLDHVLYLAWNVVSMSAAVQLFRPVADRGNVLNTVPEERVKALGLSAREVEIAILIGDGLTNKEIADKLYISPATVRTHIYNLYQKVGAGSRVELLNMLRD